MSGGEPKSERLKALYWRDEILQVVFWIEGEGLGDEVDAAVLERFLGLGPGRARAYLERLVDEELLVLTASGEYRLSTRGREEGKRIFAEEFADVTRPAHGECGPECWCHQSPEEADACAEERTAAGGR